MQALVGQAKTTQSFFWLLVFLCSRIGARACGGAGRARGRRGAHVAPARRTVEGKGARDLNAGSLACPPKRRALGSIAQEQNGMRPEMTGLQNDGPKRDALPGMQFLALFSFPYHGLHVKM